MTEELTNAVMTPPGCQSTNLGASPKFVKHTSLEKSNHYSARIQRDKVLINLDYGLLKKAEIRGTEFSSKS